MNPVCQMRARWRTECHSGCCSGKEKHKSRHTHTHTHVCTRTYEDTPPPLTSQWTVSGSISLPLPAAGRLNSSDYCCHLGLSEPLWSCEIPHIICCAGRRGLTDTEYVEQGPCFPSGDSMAPGVAESATASYRHLPGASTGWRPSCIVHAKTVHR